MTNLANHLAAADTDETVTLTSQWRAMAYEITRDERWS
jgi:hypothetical protein